MNDVKAALLAAFPSAPAIFAAIDAPSGITNLTSIILPILFFIASKTVDVFVQFYLKRKK